MARPRDLSVIEVLAEWPCPVCGGERGSHDGSCGLGLALEREAKEHSKTCPVLREVEKVLRVVRRRAADTRGTWPTAEIAAFVSALAKDCRLAAKGKARVIDAKGKVRIVPVETALVKAEGK